MIGKASVDVKPDAIADTTNVPSARAGAVAHCLSDTLVENLVRDIDAPPRPTVDGHATGFPASGFEKAILRDFNYAVEPLPGTFPLPGMGPFSLLQESPSNHRGKILLQTFRKKFEIRLANAVE